ncbi:MAG: HNH endonuclease signature motif containing protein, partial [Rhodococcus sp. (in: high G+C Gram-positive bacteria)]
QSVFGGGDEAAHVPGYGSVSAGLARMIIAESLARDAADPGDDARTMLQRVYAHPGSGRVTAMESSARAFPAGLAALIDVRDRTCRTPWCDAPIRHHDHIRPHAAGGATSADNGMGLCAGCNYAKEADGFTATRTTGPGEEHVVVLRTPTGHEYTSTPPVPPQPKAAA